MIPEFDHRLDPPFQRRRDAGHRRRIHWNAALLHRLSGVALALFLPLHFLALGLAIKGEAELDGFLTWTHQPLVKLAEAGLVGLLVVHLLGGLRVLAIENLAWRGPLKVTAIAAVVVALVAAVVFLARAA